MSNLVQLNGREMVADLRALLADAEAGRLDTVVYVAQRNDSREFNLEFCVLSTERSHGPSVVGELEVVKLEILKMMAASRNAPR